MCYFIVLMSSIIFNNVENSKNKETLEVGVSKLLTGTVYILYYYFGGREGTTATVWEPLLTTIVLVILALNIGF